MTREDLELAIIASCRIIRRNNVLVIGSQSILGSFTELELPTRATMSQEVDIAPLSDDEHESLSTCLDVFAGEWSEFDREHGFYIQGVSIRTAFLPVNWAERLVHVVPAMDSEVVGPCLEPHDLCAAKIARNESKDREFVQALVSEGLVSAVTIADRIQSIVDDRFLLPQKMASLSFINSLI